MKMRIKVGYFLLILEEHSVYYSIENSFCAPDFDWQLGHKNV